MQAGFQEMFKLLYYKMKQTLSHGVSKQKKSLMNCKLIKLDPALGINIQRQIPLTQNSNSLVYG